MTTYTSHRIKSPLLVLLAVSLLLAVTLSVSARGTLQSEAAQPPVAQSASTTAQTEPPEHGIVCTTAEAGTPTFNLKTEDGNIDTPDGNTVYMWGYTSVTEDFQIPGPVLCVNEGDEVTINLTNDLDEPVSILFPGQTGVEATGGVEGLLTREAPAGGTVSYSFTATHPGTYLYESGTNPHKQVEMGLYGALIVRPEMGPNYAYNDPATEFAPGREYLLLMHDIDMHLHLAVELGYAYDVTTREHDEYWTLNGRSLPDTVAPNFAGSLPNQPYGALLVVEPYDDTENPLPALLRFANAGLDNHPFHPHGNNVKIVAQDGRRLEGSAGEDLTYQAFTKSFGSGQTYDALITWEDADGWATQGVTLPVGIPSLQNLFFTGNTWWSGAAALGEQGELPVGVTSHNECGEYYFPWHSHALNEFQNFDEGFGGLATLWRIDPPGGCP